MASTDEDYRGLRTFFAQARRAPDPRRAGCSIFFGTSGDAIYLRSLIDRHGFTSETVAMTDLTKDGLTVEYFTLLVRP